MCNYKLGRYVSFHDQMGAGAIVSLLLYASGPTGCHADSPFRESLKAMWILHRG